MALRIRWAYGTSVLVMFLFFGMSVAAQDAAVLQAKPGFDMTQVERGRYLARVSGCNDCHTAGYAMQEGQVAETSWLGGDVLGWRGPWGTTYATNLRLFVDAMTEEQWLAFSRSFRTRPPMPWFNVRAMMDEDLRSIYLFIRYLGPNGHPAPAYVPPDKEPAPPYAVFPSSAQ